MSRRLCAALPLTFLLACAPSAPTPAVAAVPEFYTQVVNEYPHDPTAFTEGLLFHNGFLYESTGGEGQSNIRKLKFDTGAVLQRADLPPQYFGEGIVIWRGKNGKDKLIQLTYKTQVGFVYDLEKLTMQSRFQYPGEGWALTHDGKRIFMSDGTPQLRIWDPETLAETGRITVTDNGSPVANINELEFVKGEIFANLWLTERIARIDPATGKVTGWIDAGGLISPDDRNGREDVLNGIAYDAKADRLLITGKNWSKIYEVKIVKKP